LFLVAFHVGLRFDDGFRNRGVLGSGEIGVGLLELASIGRNGSNEVAVFQHGQQLACFHGIAAVHQEFLHRRRDLGHDVPLILREQRAVAGHDFSDVVLRHGRHLHRGGRFFFGGFLLLRAAGDDQARGGEHKKGVRRNFSDRILH